MQTNGGRGDVSEESQSLQFPNLIKRKREKGGKEGGADKKKDMLSRLKDRPRTRQIHTWLNPRKGSEEGGRTPEA